MQTARDQHRRATDPQSLAGRVGRAISGVVRMTHKQIRKLVHGRAEEIRANQVSRESLALLREHLLGADRDTVIELFGEPPRCDLDAGQIGTPELRETYLASDTWYFPLDSATRTILIVRFEHGIVTGVQFVDAPTAA